MSTEVEGYNERNPMMELPGHECEENLKESTKVSTTHPPLCKKRKLDKSIAWNNFSRTIDEKTKKTSLVNCIHCGKKYQYSVSNGTSTMLKHLKRCNKYPPNIDKRQKLFAPHNVNVAGTSKAAGDTDNGNVLTTWKFDQDRCRYMLARMIIIDEQPVCLVEHVGFRDFVTELQPLFTHLSLFTIARDCMKLYLNERSCLKTYFGKLRSRIALTTDTWTSVQNLNYLCLTTHFIDEDWKLHKRIINFVVIHSHKGREIGKIVEKCIYEWGIEKSVSTITVDNASSNDVAIDYLKDKFSRDGSLVLVGEVLHMRCIAHILNLIVRDGLAEVCDSIARIRNVVRYVRSSPLRAKTFQSCIEAERITYKGLVCLDVATRWNSTYLMLDTATKFRKAFERIAEDDLPFETELNNDTPKNEDWQKAIILSKFLKQFYDATNQMSGSSYITSNDYFEGITFLYKYLKDASDASDPKLRVMGMKMKEKFDKYYGSLDKVNMMVLIAVALDPTKKLHYVKFCYKQIYDDETKIDEMHDKVKYVLERLYAFYEQFFLGHSNGSLGGQTMNVGSSSASNTDGIDGNNEVNIKAWRQNFFHKKKRVHDDNKSELDRYLEEDCEDIIDLDILMWWKSTGLKYKILSLIARDVLSILVITVASESAFNTSGRVLDGFRSSLTPRVVEALICTQDWLRATRVPINVEECIENAEKFELDMDCLTKEITITK